MEDGNTFTSWDDLVKSQLVDVAKYIVSNQLDDDEFKLCESLITASLTYLRSKREQKKGIVKDG